MKELVITGLALAGLMTVLIWVCYGTIDRCPDCGSLVNTPYATAPGFEYKFCTNCGWTSATRWEE